MKFCLVSVSFIVVANIQLASGDWMPLQVDIQDWPGIDTPVQLVFRAQTDWAFPTDFTATTSVLSPHVSNAKDFPMKIALSARQLSLCLIALASVGLLRWLAVAPTPPLYAQTSPLATPWPTLVVTYQPVLPTVTPVTTPAATAVRVTFVFHSPLPTPMALPDFAPPQTTVQTSGVHSNTGWYRSPVTVTFAISDDFGAGVTAYQLDNAPAWTDREYYYPPVVITDDGVHTLAYASTDRLHNSEAPQTTQIRIDRTPPQAEVLAVDGHALPNGWYNTPVQVTFTGSDALSGLAGFAQQTTDATWVDSPAATTLATTGDHALTWRAVDKAGNVSAVQETMLQVDLTPPTTTHTLDALPVSGWYTRPVMVTLTAVDVGAGVFQTQYRLNEEAGWRTYSGPFLISGAGGADHRLPINRPRLEHRNTAHADVVD